MRYLNADKFGGLNDLLFTKLYINNNQLHFLNYPFALRIFCYLRFLR
jgi:hypothetical protein